MPRAKTRAKQQSAPDDGMKPGEGLIAPTKARHQVRFVTATSLFDGHDAAINVMRRILQASGVEVIHFGHNRSVEEIVTAALQEDANAIAVSSYQAAIWSSSNTWSTSLKETRWRTHPSVRRRWRRHRRGRNRCALGPRGCGRLLARERTTARSSRHRQRHDREIGRGLKRSSAANLDGIQEGNWQHLARLITGIEGGTVKRISKGTAHACRQACGDPGPWRYRHRWGREVFAGG